MSESLNREQEIESDLVACQLVIKQILDVIEIIPCSDKAVKSIESVPVWAR